MKARLLIGTMMLGAILHSCQDKRATPLDPTPNPHDPLGRLHLSIEPLAKVTLRSTNQDPMQEILSLRLLFYNSQSATLEHVRELKVTNPEQLKHIDIQLPPADYKLVAIGNPSRSILKLTQIGASLTKLTTPNKLTSDELYTLTSPSNRVTSVVMTPDQGPVTVSATSFSRQNGSKDNAISLRLEPAVSRILAYGNPEVRGGKRGHAPAQFVLNSLPAQVSILRPLGILASGVQEVSGDGSDPRNRYAAGGLFSAWQTGTPSSLEGIVAHHKALPQESYWATVAQDLGHAQGSIMGPNYAKEAVLPAQAYLEGATPCIVLAFPYIPSGMELIGDEGWVSFEGEHYSETKFKKIVSGSSSTENTRLIQAIRDASLSESSFQKAFDVSGIKFYKNAISYYVIYIRHFSDEQAPELNSAGRYGLVRNNEYRLKIRTISTPGSAIFPNLSKRMKPLSERHHLNAAVAVQPTITREIDVDL